MIGKSRSILPGRVLAYGEPVAGASTFVGHVTQRGEAHGGQGIAATPVKAATPISPSPRPWHPVGGRGLARPMVAAAGCWRWPWHACRHRSRSRRRLRRHEVDDRHEKRPAFDRGGEAVGTVALSGHGARSSGHHAGLLGAGSRLWLQKSGVRGAVLAPRSAAGGPCRGSPAGSDHHSFHHSWGGMERQSAAGRAVQACQEPAPTHRNGTRREAAGGGMPGFGPGGLKPAPVSLWRPAQQPRGEEVPCGSAGCGARSCPGHYCQVYCQGDDIQ